MARADEKSLSAGELRWSELVAGLCAALEIPIDRGSVARWRLTYPPRLQDAFSDAPREYDVVATGDESPDLSPRSPWFQRLLSVYDAERQLTHVVPREPQPRVADVAAALLAPYRVAGGRAHLAGCTLEDRPLIRCSTWHAAPDAQLQYTFYERDGQRVPDELAELLGATATEPSVNQAHFRALDPTLRTAVEQIETNRNSGELQIVSVVWCKFSEGKVALTIGSQSDWVPFAGWARQFVQGKLQPPPLEVAGRSSYQIVADDRGRVAIPEALATCRVSGQRIVRSDLVPCAESGQLALPQYLERCSCSGDRVLPAELENCSQCRQPIRQSLLERTLCPVCRDLERVPKHDPRLARILGEYPQLDRWRWWQLGELRECYVLIASGVTQRLLLVLDRESLTTRRAARATKLGRQWQDLDPQQWS